MKVQVASAVSLEDTVSSDAHPTGSLLLSPRLLREINRPLSLNGWMCFSLWPLHCILGAFETEQDPMGLAGMEAFLCSLILVCRNRLQPPCPSLCPKGKVQTVAS